jgi:hypothetical protein
VLLIQVRRNHVIRYRFLPYVQQVSQPNLLLRFRDRLTRQASGTRKSRQLGTGAPLLIQKRPGGLLGVSS